MPALITPSELPKWVPGKLLCASDGLGWNGVAQRSYNYQGSDVDVPAMCDFLIVSYSRGSTRMERRFDGNWTRTQCAPGDVSLLTRSQRSHWHWTEPIDVNHVYLSEALVSNVANEIMDRSVAEVRLHDVLKTEDAIVTSAVEAITREARQQSLGGPMYVEAVSTQLVVHLLRKYAAVSCRPQCDTGRLSTDQCRRLTEFIDRRLHDPISLADLAAVVGLGVCSFSRRFKETFGRAPHAHMIDRRVERAKCLLARGNLALKEIACSCGFADQAHMTRVFRLRLRTTPLAFRRNNQG